MRLSVDAARLLAGKYNELNAWYSIFVEFPELDDASIADFVNTADGITRISIPFLAPTPLAPYRPKSESGGSLPGRSKSLPTVKKHRGKQRSSLIRASRPRTSSLMPPSIRSNPLRLPPGAAPTLLKMSLSISLPGPLEKNPDAARVHEQLARKMQSVLEDQRLASLDTLFGLYDGLDKMAHGANIGDSLLPLAGTLREFEMPRPIFTEGERATWSPTVYVSRHAELQVRTDLAKVIRGPATPAQLDAARARLAPFLRDTLVGFNYAYYEPPGAQVLHANPLFVRSHDFAASSVQGVEEIWQAPSLIGIGATAGGGAYLIGSLADLPMFWP